MSVEYKIVTNRRREKRFRQLYINEGTPLANRVRITAGYFGVEIKEIVDVLENVRSVLMEGQESLFSEEERSKYTGTSLRRYFQGRLRDLGVSEAHSLNLVLGVAGQLALTDGEYKSKSWIDARLNMIRKLHGIMK